MAVQNATAARDALANNIGTALASGTLNLRTGTQPANAAATRTGTLLVAIPLGTTPFNTSSGAGQLVLASAKSGTATGTGTAGYFSYETTGGACELQGTVGTASSATTSAATSANGNVLTFSVAPPGLVVGQTVSGTGVAANTVIAALVGATVVMSKTSTAGVALGASITFGFDMNIDNASIAATQTVTVSTFTYTPGDA